MTGDHLFQIFKILQSPSVKTVSYWYINRYHQQDRKKTKQTEIGPNIWKQLEYDKVRISSLKKNGLTNKSLIQLWLKIKLNP